MAAAWAAVQAPPRSSRRAAPLQLPRRLYPALLVFTIRDVTGAPDGMDYVVVCDEASERRVPVRQWLMVGRECAGIDDDHRLVIEHAEISRNHLEIHLDHERGRALAIDLSTNGTRLNGVRLGRAIPVGIKAGDRLSLGKAELEFRSERFREIPTQIGGRTAVAISKTDMVLVAGDVIGYSMTSQRTESEELAHGMGHLFHELFRLLDRYDGVLANHAGDAFFAVWEPAAVPAAIDRASDFALAAVDRVAELAPDLTFRAPDGGPMRMGWAVVRGTVAVGSLAGALLTVIGDATNLAFRLAGLAGRDGRPPVLVTTSVKEGASDRFGFRPPEAVRVKGRVGLETVYGVASNTAG